MKKLLLIILLSIAGLYNHATAQPAPSKATLESARPNPPAMQSEKSNPPVDGQRQQPSEKKSMGTLYSPITQLPYYTDPGIIGYKDGRWIGSDHLYNLTDELGVIVEIVRVPGIPRTLDEKIIEQNVLQIFKKAGMRAFPLTGGPTPPLPFYHVLIITMPMPNGKIGYVSCRLFENVSLARVQVAEGIFWQAITWEDQTLVQTATKDFPEHIYTDVDEITDKFVKRYKHFQEMRSKFGR